MIALKVSIKLWRPSHSGNRPTQLREKKNHMIPTITQPVKMVC